jgi:hypothetical protein
MELDLHKFNTYTSIVFKTPTVASKQYVAGIKTGACKHVGSDITDIKN